MIVRTKFQVMELYLRVAKVHAVYVFISNCDNLVELKKAIPKLSDDHYTCFVAEESLFVEFKTAEEARDFFSSVVGDDGPTKTNPYDGPTRVFALLGGPEGWLTENT